MREQLVATVEEALRALLREASASEELPEFALEVPRQAEHGDFACNAALILAKRLGRPPREVAARLAERLAARTELVARAEVAGPGFVNLWLVHASWQELLSRILGRPAAARRCSATASPGCWPPAAAR